MPGGRAAVLAMALLSVAAAVPAAAADPDRRTIGLTAGGLPDPGTAAFVAVCDDLYWTLADGGDWPDYAAADAPYCRLVVAGAAVSLDHRDYAYLVRKSLRFACKGNRPSVYRLVRALEGCAGGERRLVFSPTGDGCRLGVEPGGGDVPFSAAEVGEVRVWRTDMPVWERLAMALFAPTGFRRLVDGLAGCGAEPP